jgi:hypothetical protein
VEGDVTGPGVRYEHRLIYQPALSQEVCACGFTWDSALTVPVVECPVALREALDAAEAELSAQREDVEIARLLDKARRMHPDWMQDMGGIQIVGGPTGPVQVTFLAWEVNHPVFRGSSLVEALRAATAGPT